MTTLLSEKKPVAKKEHLCMASDWLVNSDIADIGLSFAEYRAVVKAKRNRWRIKPGEQYIRQTVICCGRLGEFKAIPAIHEICLRHDLYDDAC